MKTVLDVWGGKDSANHIARYILQIDEALVLAKHELENGFLVNLRNKESWGVNENFDTRITPNKRQQ